MTFPHSIFKAYDIRGIVDDTLTVDITKKIGQAVGSEVIKNGGKSIVIGRDGRLSGPMLSEALADGLRASGVDVIDVGVAPSPVVYYSSYSKDIPSCIAITGSHNPPNYNGFKMVVEGTTLSAERIQDLKRRILEQDFESGNGGYESQPIIDDYIKRITDDVQAARPMKIVIDCGNGVAGATAPQVFKAIGCDVIELFSEVDGTFPNHHPDPSQIENLQDLIRTVKAENAELGLAFDGDGDRLGVVTAKGEIVWPDRQMILFARDILQRNPGSEIIYDVKCSRNLPVEIEAAGGQPTMWRTGHSFIKAKLKETGAALAGEMSGHIFFKERWYGFDDGVYAGARLIELLAKLPQTPQEIFDALPNSINTPELRIEFAEGEHYAFMDKLKQSADFKDAEVSKIDGLRVDYQDGFGLIRPSNTTPILVLRFEADSNAALSRIQSEFKALIQQIDPAVNTPF
ncbi:phosphoglucomutase [Arenicella chitinivorans]|uniref:phosphomannomutase n=1 Tax=Arenicella chitinivorans TaxID=1329800 RepID=A0A918S3Q0_9GAMM|nr:phosphomannomutase/phosphoglucomutase [Arenicella chitinivorans]GHA21409.1 phosphoglucomutase [Arenicella chitinivorans]